MSSKTSWQKMIAFIDMDAFFAAIEKMDNPKLKHTPIGVTNGAQGTCLITCSYEARAYGIHTGMRLKAARELCPELVQCPARPTRYAEISTAIMRSLHNISPDIEVFSVDEAFIDITHCQRYWNLTPRQIALKIQQTVFEASGVTCTVGISGDKTTAKYAAKQVKPNRTNYVEPWRAREFLEEVPVTKLCGIGKGIGRFLEAYKVKTCGDMAKLPISVLGKRFGNPGKRIWHMCQGTDPANLDTRISAPKSMGHGKVMPPNTRDHNIVLTYLIHMSEKLAARLRKHHLQAQSFWIALRTNKQWFGDKFICVFPTDHSQDIIHLCESLLNSLPNQAGVSGVQVTAIDPRPTGQQSDLFIEIDEKQQQVDHVMDSINNRYGEFALAPAQLLNRSKMPNVIAPAWKPYGHRQFIPNETNKESHSHIY